MILVTKCVAFCVPGHWGATHILLMRMERLLFVPFFFLETYFLDKTNFPFTWVLYFCKQPRTDSGGAERV